MIFRAFLLFAVSLASTSGFAATSCKDLPSQADLKKALTEARKQDNGGLNLDMWATLVDRSGIVCAVAYTGNNEGDQWPGSRVISAQKANTANAFSLPGLALSTANLYSAVQPGGSLFGLQESNPVSTNVAYRGEAAQFGTALDPMMAERIGGVNVFGGGLALYRADGTLLGGLGVSGDTSCADHNIAWRTRANLSLDFVPGGVAKDKTDQIIYDIRMGRSSSGFGHPTCVGKEDSISKKLPKVRGRK
ncbi:MAG: GlcG/HbpS family heme-binding protein [Bdellovibrionota bacterium]